MFTTRVTTFKRNKDFKQLSLTWCNRLNSFRPDKALWKKDQSSSTRLWLPLTRSTSGSVSCKRLLRSTNNFVAKKSLRTVLNWKTWNRKLFVLSITLVLESPVLSNKQSVLRSSESNLFVADTLTFLWKDNNVLRESSRLTTLKRSEIKEELFKKPLLERMKLKLSKQD